MPSGSGSTLTNALIYLILAAFPSIHPLSGSILGETIWWLVLGFVQKEGGRGRVQLDQNPTLCLYSMHTVHVQISNMAIYTG